MTQPLFPAPPTFALPLSTGNDLSVNFIYKPEVVDDNGIPVLDDNGYAQFAVADYPPGASVTLTILSTPPVVGDAVISGSNAAILIPHHLVDGLAAKLLWYVVITYATGQNQVMCNGQTYRSDGKITTTS